MPRRLIRGELRAGCGAEASGQQTGTTQGDTESESQQRGALHKGMAPAKRRRDTEEDAETTCLHSHAAAGDLSDLCLRRAGGRSGIVAG